DAPSLKAKSSKRAALCAALSEERLVGPLAVVVEPDRARAAMARPMEVSVNAAERSLAVDARAWPFGPMLASSELAIFNKSASVLRTASGSYRASTGRGAPASTIAPLSLPL